MHLHPKQWVALLSPANEILYGGAAGGGKSHLMRAAAILWCSVIPGLQVYLFRRIRDDLVKNHMEGPKGFRAMLSPLVAQGFVDIVEDEIRFWNGSKIYLCHCKDAKDVYKYQGAEIHVLLIDELTHFTDQMYRFLRNRVRMVGITLPEQYRGKFPRILCSANPGNIGHQFVKVSFIDGNSPLDLRPMPESEGGMLRQFIPALLEDNPSMAEDDPGYENRLYGLGSEALVQAMRFGDWNVVEGAFFDCWRTEKHVVRPFEVPKDWLRFRAMDWGSAKPFCVLWYAVVTDDFRTPDNKLLKRGCLVQYREYYGIKLKDEGGYEPNVGLKMTSEKVAVQVLLAEKGETIAYGVIDPATDASDGGPSILERQLVTGCHWRPADNKRVSQHGAMGGWDQLRARLEGDEDGNPMLVFFSTCIHTIRTLPVMQHDANRPEDLDSDGEDHAVDTARYACMSRPFIKVSLVTPQTKPNDRYSVREDTDSWRVA